jgi:esterase/lipase superfamily enzyme
MKFKCLAGILLLLCTASRVFPAEYALCARGVGETFTRTAYIRLTIEGPELGVYRDRVAAQLVNHLLWQDRAEQTFVEDFDDALCGSLGEIHKIVVSLSQAEMDKLSTELSRGTEQKSPTIKIASARANVSADRPDRAPSDDEMKRLVRVYYATNRQDTGEAAPHERYGSGRGEEMSFGAVMVSIPKDHRMGELETPSIFKLEFAEDSEKHVVLKSLEPLGQNAWREEVRKRAISFGRPGVLLFIHGYNSSFSEAAIRAGQLAYDLGFPGPTVFFSWPSRGSLIPYSADEQAAEWAIPDMKAVLSELAGLDSAAPIYVIAHSMGNRVLTRGLAKLLEDSATRSKRKQFREIVLAAPDIDAAVFKREIAPAILGVGPRVTLYASSNDKALAASRIVHGEYRRLGEGGDLTLVLPGMDSIDASHVTTDLLGHSYFGDSTTIMSDLFYLIRNRAAPNERFRLGPVSSPAGRFWRFKQ